MATTTTRTMFHEGELAVQRRAGVEAVASQGRPLHPRLDPTRPRRLPLPATVRRPRCHGRRRTRLGLFRRRWHRLRICPRRPPPPPGRDPRPGRGAADRLRSPMPGGDPRDRVLHPHANPIERARQSRSGRDRARRRGGFRQLPEVHPTTRPSRRARGRAGGRHPKRNLPRHRPGESGRSRRHVLHRERPRTPGARTHRIGAADPVSSGLRTTIPTAPSAPTKASRATSTSWSAKSGSLPPPGPTDAFPESARLRGLRLLRSTTARRPHRRRATPAHCPPRRRADRNRPQPPGK